MAYIVSGEVSGAAAISVRCHTIAEAVDNARVFQERGVANISISDDNGHRIDGDVLEACLCGEKSLTDELQIREIRAAP